MPSLSESTLAVEAARTDVLEAAVQLMRLEERLITTHARLPEPTPAMVESEEPPDMGANLRGTIAYTVREHVARAAADLLIAATATADSLVEDFRTWKAKH